MRRLWLYPLLFCFILPVLAAPGCKSEEEAVSLTFPIEKPDLSPPPEFTLADPLKIFNGEKVNIDNDIVDARFENCEVWIISSNLTIIRTEFINSQVFLEGKTNVAFEEVIFRDLNQYERGTLNIGDSTRISIRNCQFLSNYIGLGIHSSEASVIENSFERNNGHNALLISEGSSVEVRENYFYGNFPHAMLIMNRQGSPTARVEISRNLIVQTGEDAIDIEDYRSATPSIVCDNIIIDTGWSAIIVEYNSWQSNVTIERNWIENTGIPWQLSTHNLQPDSWCEGWGHGILVEDTSFVSVSNNRIIGAAQNGIEVRNSQNITLENNRIDCAQTGIGVYSYYEASLHRPFSPITSDNAGGSEVLATGNIIDKATGDYEVDELSELIQH
ncbi:right-handed parallel beta-helix repeat-containing protein [Chloroflexota bacterium]